jgi:hypothetical protein
MLRQQRAARQQAQKPSKPSAAPAAAPTSKKRKATDEEAEERKRTRTEEEAGVPAGFFDTGAEHVEEEGTAEPPSSVQEDASTAHAPMAELSTPKAAPLDATAEAELDAFMNEMAKEPPPKPAATYAAGAIRAHNERGRTRRWKARRRMLRVRLRTSSTRWRAWRRE